MMEDDIDEDPYFYVNYDFRSYLGESEGLEFINVINATILSEDGEVGGRSEEIGNATIKQFLFSEAMNQHSDLMLMFDNPEFGWEEGQELYDFENGDYSEIIQSFYNDEPLDPNICFVEGISLLPEFRGKGIGKRVLKDIYTRFSPGCGLFVVDIFPYQHIKNLMQTDWINNMKLDLLEPDYDTAIDKLHAYFLSLGFEKIFNNTLRFTTPHLRNTLFDSIQRE